MEDEWWDTFLFLKSVNEIRDSGLQQGWKCTKDEIFSSKKISHSSKGRTISHPSLIKLEKTLDWLWTVYLGSYSSMEPSGICAHFDSQENVTTRWVHAHPFPADARPPATLAFLWNSILSRILARWELERVASSNRLCTREIPGEKIGKIEGEAVEGGDK